MFIDVSDGVTKKQKLEHAVEGSYQVLGQDQHTEAMQRKELLERTTAGRVTLTPRQTDVPTISPESASEKDTHYKNMEGTPWLYPRIMDDCLKDDNQLEFLLSWSPNFEATWEPRSNLPEEAISKFLARMPESIPDRYE